MSNSQSFPPLLSLKQMGIIDDERLLSTKTAVLLGANQIGTLVAEALVECGLGKLILFDYEKEESGSGRRVEELRDRLSQLNPSLQIEHFNLNITVVYNFRTFIDRIKFGSLLDTQVDFLIDCSNDYDVQMSANIACNEQSQAWLTCICTSPLTGYVRLFEPGRTACFLCNQCMNTQFHNGTVSRDTSTRIGSVMPSTQSVLSGLTAQMTIKFLFNFGEVQDCVSYDAYRGTLSSSTFVPNSQCNERACCQRQKDAKNFELSQISPHHPQPPASTHVYMTQTIQQDGSQHKLLNRAFNLSSVDSDNVIDLTESQQTNERNEVLVDLTKSQQASEKDDILVGWTEPQVEVRNDKSQIKLHFIKLPPKVENDEDVVDLTESDPKIGNNESRQTIRDNKLRPTTNDTKSFTDSTKTQINPNNTPTKLSTSIPTPSKPLFSAKKRPSTIIQLDSQSQVEPFPKRPSTIIQLDTQGQVQPTPKWSPKTPNNRRQINFEANQTIKESPTKKNLLRRFLNENVNTPLNTAVKFTLVPIKVSPRAFSLLDEFEPIPTRSEQNQPPKSTHDRTPKPCEKSAQNQTPKTTLRLNNVPIKFLYQFRFADHLKQINGKEKLQAVRNLRFNMTAIVREVGEGAVLYKCCSTRNCKRRVTPIDGDRYSCSYCGIRATCKTAYRAELCVEDMTDKVELVLFDNGAEKLFGINAVELSRVFEEDPDEYQRIICRPLNKRYDFEIRYDVKTFNGTLNLTLISDLCGPYDPKRYEQHLQKRADPTRF